MEDVHEQQFSGELCGRDLVVEKGFEAGPESCAELHGGLRAGSSKRRSRPPDVRLFNGVRQ
jgi:hypothetical protein